MSSTYRKADTRRQHHLDLGGAMTRSRPVPAAARYPLAAALLVLTGAGCSGAPVDGPTTDGYPNAPAEATPDPVEQAERRDALFAFSACMRENGVADFPDPGTNGIVEFHGNADAPEFASATEQCDPVLSEALGRNR